MNLANIAWLAMDTHRWGIEDRIRFQTEEEESKTLTLDSDSKPPQVGGTGPDEDTYLS